MLELIREDCAPAAVVMACPDAILALGGGVAGELGLRQCPMASAPIDTFSTGQWAEVRAGGMITLSGP